MNAPTQLDPLAVATNLIAHTEPQPAAAEPIRDKAQRIFDPAIFRARPDGSAFLNQHGFFMPASRKRGLGLRTLAQIASAQPGAPPVPPAPVPTPPVPVPGPSVPVPSPNPGGPGIGDLPKTSAASAASAPQAWTEAEKAAAGAIPPQSDPSAASAQPGGATAQANAELIDSTEDAAEVWTRATYFGVGMLFKMPEESTPSKAEHEQLRRVAAAYLRSLGFKGSARVAVLLAFAAYLLRFVNKPAAAAKVQAWAVSWKAWLLKKPPAPQSTAAAAAARSPAPSSPRAPSLSPALTSFSERPAA